VLVMRPWESTLQLVCDAPRCQFAELSVQTPRGNMCGLFSRTDNFLPTVVYLVCLRSRLCCYRLASVVCRL